MILISDLWIEPAEFTRSLQHLHYRKHQLMVLHLLDRAEMELPYEGQVTLQDLETDEQLQIDAGDLRATYRQQVEAYLAAVRRSCNDGDAEYHPIFVDEPYDRALVKLMSRRA